MPYLVRWYIQDEIIYSRYSGAMTPEELRECMLKVKELIDISPRSVVHTINDIGNVTESVPLAKAMPIIREVGPHPRAGWGITVGEKSPLVKMAAAMGASLFKMRYKTFDTMEQALAHLKYFDETIHWEKANESADVITKA